jgi:hypothetical protein
MEQPQEPRIVSGSATLHAVPPQEQEYSEVIPYTEPEVEANPSKTGPKGKRLVAIETMGYQVGRGLKRRVVSPQEVYKLATIGCSDSEIARWFDIDDQTLRYNFKEIIEKGREELKQSLRMAQIKLALTGNAVMLIWLGKNILGQQDAPSNTDDKKALPWTDDE